MRTNKGISLIVLVVTIIVMVIIAGAIIISLTQTNVIDQAEYARERHNITVLEENLRLERQNILLEKHGTVKDEDVKVATILNLTEEDAINIATANSIPANMPSGTYYEIDGNRYATKTREIEREIALASRGIDRDNKVLTDTYVVNDNLDVYYVISGTIESKPEIDDEKVVEILTSVFMGTGDEETSFANLKQELNIEDGTNLYDIANVFYEPNESEIFCIYFYSIDRMYLMEYKEVDGEDVFIIEYANKEEKKLTYEYAAKLSQIREELKRAFVGKASTEILEKYNNATLKQYILDNCSSIKSLELEEYELSDKRIIESMSFEYGDSVEEDFCEYNSIYFISNENGVYIDVMVESGN